MPVSKIEYLHYVSKEIEENEKASLETIEDWLKNLEAICEEFVERYQLDNEQVEISIKVLAEFHGLLYLFREIVADANRSD